MKPTPEQLVSAFFVICIFFGLIVGCVGFGAALIFLSVVQAIGVGILSLGSGALLGATVFGKPVMRSAGKTLAEMDQ